MDDQPGTTDLRALRARAEARLGRRGESPDDRSPEEVIHELQVYREELLIQNDELRDTQRQLERARDELAELYHHVPIGYLTLDERGIIRRANRTFADMVGMEISRLAGRSLASFVEPHYLDRFLIRFKAFRAAPEGKTLELELQHPGQPVAVRMQGRRAPAMVSEQLEGEALLITLTDVTAEQEQARIARAASDAHRQSEARLAEALAAVNDGVWEIDYEAGTRFYSDTTFRMLGYGPPPAEEAEAFLESRMHPEDRAAYDALQARLRQCSEGYEQAVELRVRGADGGWRYILCRGRCTERNPDGSARRTIGVHTDLTARRHAEEEQARLQRELHQAHKMEALGQLAGGIAHDFNNILASILGFTELARLRLDGDPGTIGGYLGEVEKAGQRARDLVRKMLLFSRTHEPVAGDAVDVSATVTDSLGMLRPILPSSIDMETDLAEGLPPVAISSVTLQQILTNLCVNARDAMDGKGRLQIRTGLARGRGEECDACSQKVEGEWVEIAVADSGPGISPEAVSRIFDPFYTTKAAGVGTGLGLAVVHGILRTHGGHVLVESRPGQGATFRLLLPPMGGSADPVPEAPMEPVEHHSHDQHIMVIDDEPALRDYLYELLTLHGYRVSTWADPAAALAHLEGDGADVDLLLTDQTMPHMTGLELATRVRGLRPQLPLVLITGYSDEVDSRRGTGLPVDRLLPKPVGSTELLAALDELLARASAS